VGSETRAVQTESFPWHFGVAGCYCGTPLPEGQKGFEVGTSKNSLSCYASRDSVEGNQASCTA